MRAAGDLEPCPFCGHTAELTVGEHSFDDAKVRCTNCFAEGPLFDDGGEDDGAKKRNVDAAIMHWNIRTR